MLFWMKLFLSFRKMKEDPEKDTLTRVLGMVIRVANKHDDRSGLKKSLSAFAMSIDGVEYGEYENLKNWEEAKK